MRIDYADVLRQAVENERWRVLRAVFVEVNNVKTETYNTRNYKTDYRSGGQVKNDVLAAIRRVEEAS